jgi:hypothetical protein
MCFLDRLCCENELLLEDCVPQRSQNHFVFLGATVLSISSITTSVVGSSMDERKSIVSACVDIDVFSVEDITSAAGFTVAGFLFGAKTGTFGRVLSVA